MSEVCPVCQTAIEPGVTACPVCGFKLLGNTVEFKPVRLDAEEESKKHDEQLEGFLKVVRGPRSGVEYRLAADSIDVGRNPQCTIFLNDMTVSRRHATINRVDGCFIINDENSFNGVWVNNQNVTSKVLEPGDYIQIGAFCFKYDEKKVQEQAQ